MENTNKMDLRQRKVSLKTKLMSALSLLLISTILLGTSTYAWFVLSTAPEVTGMSTTVGSNGSLEIALRSTNPDTQEENAIGTGTGTSIVSTSDWTVTNGTWGNIVDLSNPAYGLDGSTTAMKLYPARLNITAAGEGFTVNTDSPLLAPRYGVDGRVSTINKTLSTGVYSQTEGGFTEGVGVRGIGDYVAGSGQTQEATKKMLAATAQTRMLGVSGRVTTEIGKATNDVVSKVAQMGLSSDPIPADVGGPIVDYIRIIKTQAEALQAAAGYALLIEKLGSDWTQSTETPGAIFTQYSSMTADQVLEEAAAGGNAANTAQTVKDLIAAATAALSAAEATYNSATNTYDNAGMRAAVTGVFEYNNMYVQTSDGIQLLSTAGDGAAKAALLLRASAVYLYANAGAIADFAEVTGKYSFHMNAANADAYVTSATYDAAVSYENVENAGYLAAIVPTTSDDLATEYETSAASGETYGFALDLTFRTNAAGGLVLVADRTERVLGDGTQSEDLIGGGSKITCTDTAVLGAVRVAFINPADGTLYAIAKAGTDGKLALQVPSINADTGALGLEAAGSQTILQSLELNVRNDVTAIVYLDGDAYEGTGSEGTGTAVDVNLQFASTATLTPMDYTGYQTLAGGITGGGTGTGGTEPTEEGLSVTPDSFEMNATDEKTLTFKFDGAAIDLSTDGGLTSNANNLTVIFDSATGKISTVGAEVGTEITVTFTYSGKTADVKIRIVE